MPDIDISKWVKDLNKSGKLSAEDEQWIVNKFGGIPEVKNAIAEGVMLRPEFSRKMNELDGQAKAKLDELTEKQAELDRLSSSLSTWRQGEEGKSAKLAREAEALRGQLAQIAANQKTLADTYGIPEDELFIPSVANQSSNVNTNGPQPPASTGLTKEEVQAMMDEKLLQGIAPMVNLTPIYMKIAMDHKAVFGTDIDPMELQKIANESLKSQRTNQPQTITQIWESKFNVAKKREEVNEANIQARINREVEEKVTAIKSELNLPSSRPSTPASPVLGKTFQAPRSDGGMSEGVKAAINAYNKGTYQTKIA